MSKPSLDYELNGEPAASVPLDAVAAREERRATGRMCAVLVALLMIFSGFYHAWIKRIPVLAGVMVPALIMLLYAAWVLFLAKREKQRRLNAENHMRSSMTALSEILIQPASADRRHSHNSNMMMAEHHRRLSQGGSSDTSSVVAPPLGRQTDRRFSHSNAAGVRLHPAALQLLEQHHLSVTAGHRAGERSKSNLNQNHHHHQHHSRNGKPTRKHPPHHHSRRSSNVTETVSKSASRRESPVLL